MSVCSLAPLHRTTSYNHHSTRTLHLCMHAWLTWTSNWLHAFFRFRFFHPTPSRSFRIHWCAMLSHDWCKSENSTWLAQKRTNWPSRKSKKKVFDNRTFLSDQGTVVVWARVWISRVTILKPQVEPWPAPNDPTFCLDSNLKSIWQRSPKSRARVPFWSKWTDPRTRKTGRKVPKNNSIKPRNCDSRHPNLGSDHYCGSRKNVRWSKSFFLS